MATGDHIGPRWSEPGAGSDMAAIRTTAVLEGDHYKINGQKTCLQEQHTLTGPWLIQNRSRFRKTQRFIFHTSTIGFAGITVRPIPQLDGEPGFAEIYFDDVKVL